MPRTPMPADSAPFTFELWSTNEAHLDKRIAESAGKNFSDIINAELEYVRNLDLLPQYVRRITHDAKSRGASFRDEVKKTLFIRALELPPVKVKLQEQAPIEGRRTSAILTGPNHAYLLHLSTVSPLSMTKVFNTELLFAQHYDLTPELFARVEHAARQLDVPVRAYVTDLLNVKAFGLPDVPAKDTAKPRTRHS